MAKGAVRSVNIYVNNKEAIRSMDDLKMRIEAETRAWQRMAKGTSEYYAKAAEISRMQDALDKENKLIMSVTERRKKSLTQIGMVGSALSGLVQTVQMLSQGLQKVRDLASDMAGLDDAMGRVRKTTNLTRQEVQELNKEFTKIDTRTSREELNELAYAAGKLGIQGKEDVLEFVKAADVINVALGDVLGGTDAIIEVTKLAQVFKSTTKEIENTGLEETLIRTGSVINELGKTSTANEGQIEKFLMRIASYASIAGMSLDQMAGIGSVLSQNSKAPEMSATAVTKIMQQMIKKTGSFAEMIGMGEKELSDLMAKDFNQAFLTVLQKLHDIGDVQSIVPIFKDLGADATRASQVILALSTNIDKVREAQLTANTAIKEGTSMNKEYSVMNDTLQAQMEKAKKTVFDARVELGEKLYPYIVKYTMFGGKVIKWLSKVTEHAENAWMAVAAAGAVAIAKVRKNWDGLRAQFNELGAVQEWNARIAATEELKAKNEEIAKSQTRQANLEERLTSLKQTQAKAEANLNELQAKREALTHASNEAAWLTQAQAKQLKTTEAEINTIKAARKTLEQEETANTAMQGKLKKQLAAEEKNIIALKNAGKEKEAELTAATQRRATIKEKIAVTEQQSLRNGAALTAMMKRQQDLEALKAKLMGSNLSKQERLEAVNAVIEQQEKDINGLLRNQQIIRGQIANETGTQMRLEEETKILKKQSGILGFIKNHWLLIATILLEIGIQIAKMVKESRKLQTIYEETTAEMEKEKDSAERLFNALENVNTTEEERAAIMKTLNEKYGTYLTNLTNEEGKLWNIEAAHRAVIKAIEDEAAAKGFQKAKDELSDQYMGDGKNFGLNLTELQEAFEKILLRWVKSPSDSDRMEAARNANKIAEALRSGTSRKEIESMIGTMGYTKDLNALLNTPELVKVGKGMKSDFIRGSLTTWMDKYTETFDEFNQKVETAAERFGVNTKKGAEKLAEDLKEYRKYESQFQNETEKIISNSGKLQLKGSKSYPFFNATDQYAASGTSTEAAVAESLAYKKRTEMTADITNMIIEKLFGGKNIDQVDKETRKAALEKLESEGIKLLGDDVAEMGEEVADMFTNAAAMVTARIRNASHQGGNGSNGTAEPETDGYDPEHPVTSGKKSGKSPEERWADLMRKSAKLNEKAVVESLGISNAKESVIKAYDAILKEVEAFNGTYEGFKEKADAEIARLEQEKWNEISRIEGEERKKRLLKIDENLSSVTEKLNKFQLKQQRKRQTQLETDLQEIANDWEKLRNKTEEERNKLTERKDASLTIGNMFDWAGDREVVEQAFEDNKELFDKIGITREKWEAALKQKPTSAKSLLELLGIYFSDEDEDKLRKIDDALKNIDATKVAEIQGIAAERAREITTAMSDSATKQYLESLKTIEDQILTLEAAQEILRKENADGKNDERLKQIEETLKFLRGQKSDITTKYETGFGKDTWAALFGIDEQNWDNWGKNWEDNLEKMTDKLKTFADNVFDLWSSIDSIMQNQAEAEMQRTEELYDSKSAALKKQLDSGMISQKRYDAQMEKLQKEKEKKEKKLKHDAFERERAANLIQGAVNLALTISSIYAKEPGGLVIKSAAAAIAAAVQAVQIAAIASQPNPYAHGGYIEKKQYAVMGEEGPEWVASNKLLRDKETKPIVAALDEYQKGNTRALERITMPAPSLKNVSQAMPANGRNFAASNTTNYYYQADGIDELLKETRQMNQYLRDPKNRQAYITRELQLEFEQQEEEVRAAARM